MQWSTQVRLLISLFVGTAVGVPAFLGSTAQLRLRATQVLPKDDEDDKSEAHLGGISSTGRFATVYSRDGLFRVFDRDAGTYVLRDESAIHRILGRHHGYARSPDGNRLASITTYTKKGTASFIRIYDLESPLNYKSYTTPASVFLFSQDGRLLALHNGALTEVETGKEMRRQEEIRDGFVFKHTNGTFAIYEMIVGNDQRLRSYSILTGEFFFETDSYSVDSDLKITAIFPDGLTYTIKFTSAPGETTYLILDAATGASRPTDVRFGDNWISGIVSPDGRLLVQPAETQSALPDWLRNWLNLPASRKVWRFVDWRKNEELGTIPRDDKFLNSPRISPRGDSLAMLRNQTIEVYDFPFFHRPWGWIIGTALAAAISTWTLLWLWSRRRAAPSIATGSS